MGTAAPHPLGYYNDPERTARAFIQNPRHAHPTDIGYRTGDLVQRDARGWLHFRGRADYQIKHMGYRIELEEIEAAFNSLPGVKECAVIYQKLGDGLGQILAFAATRPAMSPEDLLQRVATIVPPTWCPAACDSSIRCRKTPTAKSTAPPCRRWLRCLTHRRPIAASAFTCGPACRRRAKFYR